MAAAAVSRPALPPDADVDVDAYVGASDAADGASASAAGVSISETAAA